MLRECKVCHVIKPLEAFPKHKPAKDGYRQPCRVCFSAQNAARYAADLETNRAKARAQYHKHKKLNTSWRQRDDKKICRVCHEEKPLEHFASAHIKRYPLLRRGTCRECLIRQYPRKAPRKVRGIKGASKHLSREQQRLYKNTRNAVYLQDPTARQLLRERIKRYNKRHPDRRADVQLRRVAQKKGSPITDKVMREMIYERDNGICHICHEPVARAEMSIDHLIPLADKGPHTLRNVALAHKRCNFRRGKGRLPAQLRLF